jgi:predicted branched-subunit amino acid permease
MYHCPFSGIAMALARLLMHKVWNLSTTLGKFLYPQCAKTSCEGLFISLSFFLYQEKQKISD